jgi:hypothetical protein
MFVEVDFTNLKEYIFITSELNECTDLWNVSVEICRPILICTCVLYFYCTIIWHILYACRWIFGELVNDHATKRSMRMSGCKQIYIHIVLSLYQALAASVLNN